MEQQNKRKTTIRRAKKLFLRAAALATALYVAIVYFLPPNLFSGESLTLCIAFAVLYFTWWSTTVVSFYQAHEMPKTEEWARKTSRGLVIAVPILGVIVVTAGSLVTTLVFWAAGETETTIKGLIMPQLLAIPFAAAAILSYIPGELQLLVQPDQSPPS
jgi:hypothetical protein